MELEFLKDGIYCILDQNTDKSKNFSFNTVDRFLHVYFDIKYSLQIKLSTVEFL